MYLYPGSTKSNTLTVVFKYINLLSFVLGGSVFPPAPCFNPLPHLVEFGRIFARGNEQR